MKTLFLAFALAFAPGPSSAQPAPPAPATAAPAAAPQPDANPALWVVRDADTTIYLFGTFHLLDHRTWFNDEVKTAFDASDELVMEAILPEDPASLAPMIMHYAIDQSGRKLSDRLTPADNAALTRAVEPLHIPVAAFDRFKPWFASMLLSATEAQRSGLDAANGPETILSHAAAARHMPIGELEGLEWQIHLFDNMPDALQLADLHSTLQELDSSDQVLGSMLAAWAAGDVDALVRIMESQTDTNPELRAILLTNRNAAWARWIHERLARPGTVFIAVGAGHLAGSGSVQSALEAQGIHVVRVAHATVH